MSKEQAHYDQYEHNLGFMKDCITDQQKYSDWSITVTFYCGVHLVESMLAKKMDEHPHDHSERELLIKTMDNVSSFYNEYRHLYSLSRKARYQCIQISDKDLYNAQVDLDAILNAYKAS